jgi:hypothetical protein
MVGLLMCIMPGLMINTAKLQTQDERHAAAINELVLQHSIKIESMKTEHECVTSALRERTRMIEAAASQAKIAWCLLLTFVDVVQVDEASRINSKAEMEAAMRHLESRHRTTVQELGDSHACL